MDRPHGGIAVQSPVELQSDTIVQTVPCYNMVVCRLLAAHTLQL